MSCRWTSTFPVVPRAQAILNGLLVAMGLREALAV